jgi:hypothetical protein
MAAVVFCALMAASTANAHDGVITVDCSNVTFNFANFSPGDGDISYEVDIDNNKVSSGVWKNAATSTQKVPINITGNHLVAAIATWNTGRVETQINAFCSTVEKIVPGPTVYVDKIVWGKPTCAIGKEVSRGDGYVICQTTKIVTKTVIKKVPVTKIVIKKVLVPVPCRVNQVWNEKTHKCVNRIPAG